jgi:Phage integrase, N-terminal SAM-like domain/Arm DNA-binding domain
MPPGPNGERRQRRVGGFATEREARQAMQAALAQIRRGSWVEFPKLTVAQYLDQWLAGKARLRASTRRSYQEHIDLYLRPALGHIMLADLRDEDVEQLYEAMRALGRGEAEE